jgi:hypothetical protein
MPGNSGRRKNIQSHARAVIRTRGNVHALTVITACLAALHVESCVNMRYFDFCFYNSVNAGTVHRSKRVKCVNYRAHYFVSKQVCRKIKIRSVQTQ